MIYLGFIRALRLQGKPPCKISRDRQIQGILDETSLSATEAEQQTGKNP